MKLSPEQVEFQDTVRNFLQEVVPSTYIRDRISAGRRTDGALWQRLAELGFEEGFGAEPALFSIEELGLLAFELGYALSPEPLATRILATHVAPRMALLGYDPKTTTIAPRACCDLVIDPTDGALRGSIIAAPGCEGAEQLLAFASTSQGVRCVLIQLSAKGVQTKPSPSLDLTVALTDISLDSAAAISFSAEASAMVEDLTEAVYACEAAGVCQRVIEMTCGHVKTRSQFGRPIGSFQAVQQQLAQAHAHAESLSSLSRFAIWAAAHSPEQRALTARAAITQAADSAPRICEVAIQCHGGIGFTWEYDLHLYLRRALSIQAMFRLNEQRAEELLARAG